MILGCPQRVGFVVAALFWGSSAYAAPGQHFVIGSTTISPGIAAGVDYSTNPYHVLEVTKGSDAVDVSIGPKLELKLQRDDFDVGLGGTYSLRKYFGTDVNLDRYDDFTAHLDVDALKKSIVGLRLNEDAGLVNYPMENSSSSNPYTSETTSETAGVLAVRPGYSLEITAGGEGEINDYSTSVGDASEHYNTRFTYGPKAGAMWKFLPRTAVVLDFSYLHSSYALDTVTLTGFEDTVFDPHNVMRIDGGLRGRVTNRLVVTLVAGYGSAAYGEAGAVDKDNSLGGNPDGGKITAGEALQHMLADASMRYNITETSAVTLGVSKDFRDSFFTNYVSYFKGYAALDARFGDHIGVLGGGDLSSEAFRGSVDRNDLVANARADVNYYIREWVWLNLGGGWQHRVSDDATVQYDEFTGHLKVNLAY